MNGYPRKICLPNEELQGFIGTPSYSHIALALQFKKPMLLIPLPNHIEHYCNSYILYKEGFLQI